MTKGRVTTMTDRTKAVLCLAALVAFAACVVAAATLLSRINFVQG